MSVKKLANPLATDGSTLRVHHSTIVNSELEKLPMAEYAVEVSYAESFDSIVVKIDGVNKTLPLDIAEQPTTRKGLRVSIANALKTEGYDPYYTMDNYRGISTTGNYLSIIGEAELISIFNDSTKTFDKFSTESRIFHTSWLGIDTTVALGILTQGNAAGGDLGTFAGTHGSDPASVVTAVEGILTGLGIKFNRVTFTQDSGDIYDLNIWSDGDSSTLTLDGSAGTRVKVYPGFVS